MQTRVFLGVLASHVLACAAIADVNVGVTLSATGPAASLGIPERNTFEMLPKTIAGEKINWIVLDDASDTTKAVTNTCKLIAEDKVDVIVGSTITPNSLAMIGVPPIVGLLAMRSTIGAQFNALLEEIQRRAEAA